MDRIPGQVPSREAIDALRLAQQAPPKFTPAMMLRQGGAYMTPKSVVEGLGLDRAQESSWTKFLETTLHAPNEVVMRKAIMARTLNERMDPALRKAILERAIIAYRGLQKALITTPDELLKGEPKGGKYVRRVPNESKRGYRYFYDEEQYKKWGGAHMSGEEATTTAIRSGIQKAVQNAGAEGCDLKALKPLVKRYGSKAVASVLDDDVKKSGKVRYKNGRLFAGTPKGDA